MLNFRRDLEPTYPMQPAESPIRSRLLHARLPAMPQILLKLLEHCQTDEAGMADLASLIAKDPGIASKIFAVANSSAYHRSGMKLGLEQALAAIGTDMVKTLVISESVFQIFNSFSHSNGTDLRRFWKHSLGAAVIAREIASRMRYPHIEEAYLAGLLHDVGRLALLATAPTEYAAAFQAADDASLCAVEQRLLQMTHAEAGAWLIEHWHLDSFLADSVLYHHESAARLDGAHPLIRIVRLAHLLASHEADDPAVAEAGALCGLGIEALAEIAERAVAQVQKAADHLGIDLAGADDLPPAVSLAAPEPADPTREKLSEEVRNLVLASSAARSFGRHQSEAELLETVTRSARILFGLEDAVLLQMDATGHALIGAAVGQHRQRLAQFSVAVDANGAVAAAARLNRPAYVRRSGELLGVAEEQLLRLLGTEALVAVPLTSAGRCSAVLIGGLAPSQLADLQRRERFLHAFAGQASKALVAASTERSTSDEHLASVTQEYRDASRRVAHEVNNPLSIIKNYLAILDSKLLRQEPVTSEMSILNEEIDRVGQIVNGLAEMQPGAVAAGNTDVNVVLAAVVRLFNTTEFVPASVRIVTGGQDQPGHITASGDIVRQILMNLMKNAIEAMPQGGEITVANDGILNRDGRVYLELSIRDTGPGIPADILVTLFSPGRSTKSGAHRGQGLAIVQALVRQVDGQIMCRSSSKGTTFEVLLPVPVMERQTPARHDEVRNRGAAGVSPTMDLR